MVCTQNEELSAKAQHVFCFHPLSSSRGQISWRKGKDICLSTPSWLFEDLFVCLHVIGQLSKLCLLWVSCAALQYKISSWSCRATKYIHITYLNIFMMCMIVVLDELCDTLLLYRDFSRTNIDLFLQNINRLAFLYFPVQCTLMH